MYMAVNLDSYHNQAEILCLKDTIDECKIYADEWANDMGFESDSDWQERDDGLPYMNNDPGIRICHTTMAYADVHDHGIALLVIKL